MKSKSWHRNLFLALADVLCVTLSLAVTFGVFCLITGNMPENQIVYGLVSAPAVLVLINNFSALYSGHFFSPGIGVGKVEELKRLSLGIVGSYLILTAYLGLVKKMDNGELPALGGAFLLTFFSAPLFRFICRYLLNRLGVARIKVLIAGAGKMGKKVAEQIRQDSYYGFETAGFVDDTLRGEDICGTLEQAGEIARQKNIDYLIICTSRENRENRGEQLIQYLKYFRHVLILPTDRVLPVMWTRVIPWGYSFSFEINNRLKMNYLRFSKSFFEIVLAVCLVPVFLPLGILIAFLIKITSAGPVFYQATRLGQHGKTIRIWKFRTMYQGADAALETLLENNPDMKKEWEAKFKLENDPRITPLGKILRKTSLDELPQFLNVLKGDIAIIGPRPIVEDEKHYYGEKFSVFSSVKPGITGLWQISGRNNLDYAERVNLDVFYVSNWRLWLDYYIFLKTFIVVLSKRGAR